jgi:hypothetical protein
LTSPPQHGLALGGWLRVDRQPIFARMLKTLIFLAPGCNELCDGIPVSIRVSEEFADPEISTQ